MTDPYETEATLGAAEAEKQHYPPVDYQWPKCALILKDGRVIDLSDDGPGAPELGLEKPK